MISRKNSGIDSAVYLAALTGFFYCTGSVYDSAYWGTLQLDPNMLDTNVYQTLLNGFIFSSASLLYSVGGLLSLWFLWAWQWLPFSNDWLLKHPSFKIRLESFALELHGGRQPSDQERHHKTTATQRFFWLLAFIGLFLVFQVVGNTGKRDAMKLVRKIEAQSCPQRGMIVADIAGTPRSLLGMGCGSRNCAGIDLATKTIYYFPSTGHSFQYIQH